MLKYNANTGMFRHVQSESNNARKGWFYGSKRGASKRLTVWFNNKNMSAHRVAWYLHYGEWPKHTIDHINGDPSDNRICNLRDVSQQVNNRNILVARTHNAVGVLGVTKFRKGYRARITVDGKSLHLGCFTTVESASAAYQLAKEKFHV